MVKTGETRRLEWMLDHTFFGGLTAVFGAVVRRFLVSVLATVTELSARTTVSRRNASGMPEGLLDRDQSP